MEDVQTPLPPRAAHSEECFAKRLKNDGKFHIAYSVPFISFVI